MWGGGVSAGGRGSGGGEGGVIGVSPRATGYGLYRDTRYTQASPLILQPDLRVLLPNNAGNKNEGQLPEDIASFYNPVTGRIPGTLDCDIIVTARFMCHKLDIDATSAIIEVDSGLDGSPFKVEESMVALPFGTDSISPMSYVFSGYCGTNFTNNGARIFITPSGSIAIWGIQFIIKRTHKAV